MTNMTMEGNRSGSVLRRMILLLAVAAVMGAMMIAMAGSASAAGNGFAKGKGSADVSTNPGENVNDSLGDAKNFEVADLHSIVQPNGKRVGVNNN